MSQKMKETRSGYESHQNQSKIFNMSNSISRELSELQKKVALSSTQLIQCTTDQEKFLNRLQYLNSKAIQKIKTQNYEESLVFLGQAERILEYVASCGKVIDRNLIIVILHNQACAYQKMYDLPQLTKYLEALIYNLGISLENSQANSIDLLKNQKAFMKGTWQFEALCVYIKRKINYGQYYLQYSTLNSKNYEHQTAIKHAKQAISIYKSICQICQQFKAHKINSCKQSKERNNWQNQNKLLSMVDIQLSTKNYSYYLSKVRKMMVNFPFKGHLYYQQIQRQFSQFSIGKIIQICPLSIEQAQQRIDLNQQSGTIGKIYKCLFLSAGFFTIGTQFRLLSSQSQTKNQNLKSSQQFLLSQVYHLFCIFLVLNHMPCETRFLRNLLISYNNHYEVELENSKNKSIKNNREIEQFKQSIPIQMLPENSSIQEGQSKWSRSQLKSPSSQRVSERILSAQKSNKQNKNILMIKRKSKIGIQYKVNTKSHESQASLGRFASSQKQIDSFRESTRKIQYVSQKMSTKSLKNKNPELINTKSSKKCVSISKKKKKSQNNNIFNQYLVAKNPTKSKSKDYRKSKSKQLNSISKQKKDKVTKPKVNSKIGTNNGSQKNLKKSKPKKILEGKKKEKKIPYN